MLRRELEEVGAFIEARPCLHGDGPGDVAGRKQRCEVGRFERTAQGREIVRHPIVGGSGRIPEVLVGDDDRGNRDVGTEQLLRAEVVPEGIGNRRVEHRDVLVHLLRRAAADDHAADRRVTQWEPDRRRLEWDVGTRADLADAPHLLDPLAVRRSIIVVRPMVGIGEDPEL